MFSNNLVDAAGRGRWVKLTGCAAVALAALLPWGQSRADGLVGVYFGGGIGQSDLEATLPGVPGSFSQSHFSYKAILGVRPISLLGGEVQYVSLGGPGTADAPYSAAGLKLQGAAAYGMLYLPFVPVVDVYLKAGLARLQSTVNNGFVPVGPGSFAFERTNTSATEGLGVQYGFGQMHLRADYSFFNAAGGHQNMLTADVVWTFF